LFKQLFDAVCINTVNTVNCPQELVFENITYSWNSGMCVVLDEENSSVLCHQNAAKMFQFSLSFLLPLFEGLI
jgi:RNA polymerase subunit RPABC4/transcription elongation factor Spt4